MLLWRVHKNNSGFTLIEMIVVTIVVGVLASIAAPNLLGLLNRNRINEGIRIVEGALKEAQKQATRNGKRCTININANGISNSGANDCLLENRTFPNNLVILSSNQSNVVFSGRGNIVTSATDPKPLFVTYMANGSNKQSCIVIESSLGSIRTGDYTGDPSEISDKDDLAANCQ